MNLSSNSNEYKRNQIKEELNRKYENTIKERQRTNYEINNVDIYKRKGEVRYNLFIGILCIIFSLFFIFIYSSYIFLLEFFLLILGLLIFGIGQLIIIVNEKLGLNIKYISVFLIIWGTIQIIIF